MSTVSTTSAPKAWLQGVKEATPLLGGYIPVAISFGLIATQAGFSQWETIFISTLIYAGASQFLFVAMFASGAPLWLIISMTLLINARHIVYGPNLAPLLPASKKSLFLMHGLTDQIFALALARLPAIPSEQRESWFSGAMLLAWFSWVGGTAAGAQMGETLIAQWPFLAKVMPFALPALFLVLLAPRFTSRQWSITLLITLACALGLKLIGWSNAAIPVAAALGTLLYYMINSLKQTRG